MRTLVPKAEAVVGPYREVLMALLTLQGTVLRRSQWSFWPWRRSVETTILRHIA